MPIRRAPLPAFLALAATGLAGLLLAGAGGARAATVTVGPGETLSAIAARNGTTVAAIAAANGIRNPDRVVAGRRLTVPGAPGGSSSGGSGGSYVVRRGDTLGAIAARSGTSVAAISALNGIADPARIIAGRRIRIPSGGAVPATSAPAAGRTYRVRGGDTLSAIAARNGTSAAAIAATNGLADPNRLVAGRLLRLPAYGSGSGGTAGRPVGMASIVPGGPEVGALIDRMAARHGVPPSLARAVGWQESRWSQSALSHVGAVGVMQLMPYTARWFGPAVLGRRINPHRIDDNVEGGVAYLGWLMRQTGSERLAVGSYYQGLGATRSRGFYDETKRYVASVMSFRGRV
jgi:N-acetylmuramoyl-L-alanine amidase